MVKAEQTMPSHPNGNMNVPQNYVQGHATAQMRSREEMEYPRMDSPPTAAPTGSNRHNMPQQHQAADYDMYSSSRMQPPPPPQATSQTYQVPSYPNGTAAVSGSSWNRNQVASSSAMANGGIQQNCGQEESTSNPEVLTASTPGVIGPQPQRHQGRGARAFNTSWSQPPRILVVEDDVVARRVSGKFLQVFGCSIDEATDGETAVTKMNGQKYDLVLMVGSLFSETSDMN
jgi:CheY-like chemotaxis protein